MTYLEINPFWYVPAKIAKEDLLPKIQEDPYYLDRQDFRVFEGWDKNAQEVDPNNVDWASFSEDHFPYRLRQEPAVHNALGRVKFVFPNELSVYIHDTPSKRLFKRSARDLSSGCVRVEKPLDLMKFLLGRQHWNQKRLAKVVASKQRQVVLLKKPIPVYLVYFTAWAEENGEINFTEDIYGQDQELFGILTKSAAASQPCESNILAPTYFVQSRSSHPAQSVINRALLLSQIKK